ncbi:hypothetical protein TNCV_3736871 [Trichonephila clavipes]|nr:hypothetical protein TNCV_3736871 [Trichonephila clavipes]
MQALMERRTFDNISGVFRISRLLHLCVCYKFLGCCFMGVCTPRISYRLLEAANPDRKGLATRPKYTELHGQSIVHHMLHPSDSEQKY